MLGLKDNTYMVSVFSGTLQIVDIDAQTNNIYSHNHKGTSIQSLVPFPEFNEEQFPLVLIKEQQYVVIFNIKVKQYIKIADVKTSFELEDGTSSN